jgi:hypothetical protein
MSRRLQLFVLATVAAAGLPISVPPAEIEPVDVPVNDTIADAVATAILAADQSDAVPGDGKLEEKIALHEPVKVNLGFIHLNEQVNVELEITLQLSPDGTVTAQVADPSAAAAPVS